MAAPNIKSGSSVTTVTGKTVGYAVTTTNTAALSNAANSGKVLKVNSVYCANVNATAAADISLDHFNGTTGYRLANSIAVPAKATQVLVTREAYIYIEEGQSLRALGGTAGDLELVISYEEIS